MKKIIAMLLCVALVAALGVTAFADYPTDPVDSKSKTAKETAIEAGMKPYTDDIAKKSEWITITNELKTVATEYENAMAAAAKLTGSEKAIAEYEANQHLTKELAALKVAYPTFTAAYFDATNYQGATPTFTSKTLANDIAVYEAMIGADNHALDILADDYAAAKAIGDRERSKAKLWEAYNEITNPTAVDTAKLNVALNKVDADIAMAAATAAKTAAAKTYANAQASVAAAQKAAKGVITDVVALAKVDAAATVATAQAVAYAAAAAEYNNAVAAFNAEVSTAIADALTELGY